MAQAEQQTQSPKMVKIERKYLFAGKEVVWGEVLLDFGYNWYVYETEKWPMFQKILKTQKSGLDGWTLRAMN